MEDRCLHRLRDVGRVIRRTGGFYGSRETELVVDHEVHGPTGPVTAQLGELQGLGHDSLAGKSRIAVDEYRQDVVVPGITALVVARPSDSFDDGVDRFEVGRVEASVTGSSAPLRAENFPLAPLWYFTSPEPCTVSGSMLPSNSAKISRRTCRRCWRAR